MSFTEDRYRAMAMVEFVSPRWTDIRYVVHQGDPVVKARARVVRGHAYTPHKTMAAQEALAERLRGIRFEGNVAVCCVFRRRTRQWVDIDNLLKLVLDAGTQACVWDDDSQVTAVMGVLEFDESEPGTVVAFAEHESSMRRGVGAMTTCEACGRLFKAHTDDRRHCSRSCRMTLADPVPCAFCGEPFKRVNANSKYCSVACRGRAQRRSRPCAVCGNKRARADSTLCRACWRARSGA